MSELAAYLKKNIKLAAKSVWYHRGQYLCFFIAMLVTEIFCGLAVMAAHNNNVLERKYIAAEYDYNLELRNLNSDQYYYMLNDDYTVFTSDHIYDVVRTETHINEVTGEKTYNLFIKFLGDSKTNYDTFSKRYFNDLSALDKNGRLAIAASALQKIDSRISANAADNVTIFILVTLLSIGLVTALYNIRINYYKFEYGIYMTFGADFKRLFVTSLWEMFIIAAVVYIPAVIFSALISAVVYGYAGESFEFFAAAPLYIFVFALIVAGMSVLLPIWRLSRRTPMANIIAEDNSNLIVSPRISFEMLGKNYPRGYELISAWRFRLYNLRLYALTAFFTVLVTMLIFSAGMIRQNEIIDYPQFKILLTDKHSYDGGTPNGFMRDELLKIPGVTGIEKKQEVFAFNTNSFVMFDPSNTTFLSDFPLYHEKYRATYHAVYKPADSEVVEILSKYKFTGDLNSVLTNEKTVIISDSLGNIKRLNIKPGDKIRISKFVKEISKIPFILSNDKMFEERLWRNEYDDTEYTVGAVLHNIPNFINMPVYLSNTDFTAQTGEEVKYNAVDIFVDYSLSINEVKAIEKNLYKWADYYPGAKIYNYHSLNERNIIFAKNKTTFLSCIAMLLLTITPMLWFLSQILFYHKRRNEYNVLLAMGGLMREVKKQHIIDSIISFIGSAVTFTIFTFVMPYSVYQIIIRVIAPFQMIDIYYTFALPWLAVVISALTALFCAFMSSYIPFLMYKHTVNTVNAEYGGED